MTRLSSLPPIMVAPNGARRGKADHPELPVTIAETVATAKACHAAGAGALHAHVRDGNGNHVLDSGLYAELLAEMARVVPDMAVQITTEAVGRYTPVQQRALMGALQPDGISIGLREMLADGDIAGARRAYHAAAEAKIAVQHILYAPEDVTELAAQIKAGVIPQTRPQVIFVLGRYTTGQQSEPADLAPYLAKLAQVPSGADWALCAFGAAETACLAAAFAQGGKARVGFENSLWHADGSMARDNAERVEAIAALLVP